MVIEEEEEVNRILERARLGKEVDLEAWETGMRVAVLAAGARALGGLLAGIGSGRRGEKVICECGEKMESQGVREKQLSTILGTVSYSRTMFQCEVCHKTRYPGDEKLDIVGTGRSPGLRRMMGRAGSKSTFKEGRDDLKVYAGVEVSAKDVERVAERIGEAMEEWCGRERAGILRREMPVAVEKTMGVFYVSYDGTGVPMVKEEVKDRKGKQADGTALTREAKLGCVFRQTTTDAEGFPIRDPDTTSFVGAIETAEEFGWRIYAEAVRRGLWHAERVVVLGDGAEWIKNLAQTHFHGATQIVDLYHARQHVSELCKVLFTSDEKQIVRHRIRWWTTLDAGNVEKIVGEAQRKLPQEAGARKRATVEITYLEKNMERMRYADFRAQGFFVGSGVVEAGCKTVIGQRLKQSGMEWSVRGANAIISLRCMMKSGRLEDYWDSRTA